MCREIMINNKTYTPPDDLCTCCLVGTERAAADPAALAHFGSWVLDTYRQIAKEEGQLRPVTTLTMK